MDVKNEIEQHSLESDKPILLWLFGRYHQQWQWKFVADMHWKSYGTQSYQAYRVWSPTSEGRILYDKSISESSKHQTIREAKNLFLISVASTSSMHSLISTHGVIEGIEQDAKDYCDKMNCKCKGVYSYAKLKPLA